MTCDEVQAIAASIRRRTAAKRVVVMIESFEGNRLSIESAPDGLRKPKPKEKPD